MTRIKSLDFLVSSESKINTKNFNMEVCVKNSKKKTSYFEQSKENFLPLYMNHVQKTKNLTTGIINGLLNSIISKYFKLNSG